MTEHWNKRSLNELLNHWRSYILVFDPQDKVYFPRKPAEGPKSKQCTASTPMILEPQLLHHSKNLVATINLSEVIQTPDFLSTARENWLLLASVIFSVICYLFMASITFLMMLKCFSKPFLCQLLTKQRTIWHLLINSEWIWMKSLHEKQPPLDYTEHQPLDLPCDTYSLALFPSRGEL